MSGVFDVLKVILGKRFPFKIIYSSDYWLLDIGRHVFPVRKYRLLYEQLVAMGARKEDFLAPEPAADEDVLAVHTARYVKKLRTGALLPAEKAALELPFSPELVKFAFLSVGGTLLAARRALEDGLAVHLGGGFHHAFPDHGEGFCVLNDVAVAIETLRREQRVRRAMIVDVDLHQGNGTAAVFAGRDDVFTFSIHQMDIYPSVKPPGSLDVGLWSGAGDAEYLSALQSHFPRLFRTFQPDLVVYLAGADPHEKDQLGGLRLTAEGLERRDRLVIEGARRLGVPVAVVLGGGYAADVTETVAVHLNTIRTARRAQRLAALTKPAIPGSGGAAQPPDSSATQAR